ncbi:MAG: divalent-cation tolerance protein CutA [Deltaproteobacteria bacterium CG17_big_fil_post_rev_8_21_14_2_50_51_6]|nr:MAG: divalent-cation tolerance protein CutA [Deltaproteobacteria bacterium CG17_big_fil_post_rev_8_21_14_2_50_51_6]
MEVLMVYITASDLSEARKIGEAVVEERLAACVNIVDGAQSIYRWYGKIQHEKEAIIIAKTRKELLSMLIDRVRSLHSYECPCVVALPIEAGYEPFLEWVGSETGASGCD